MLLPALALLPLSAAPGHPAADPALTFENRWVRLVLDTSGRTVAFVQRATGANHVPSQRTRPFCAVKVAGREWPATSAERRGEVVAFQFGGSGVGVSLRIRSRPAYLAVEVVSVTGDPEEIVMADVALDLKGEASERFAACALALNLRANVAELPSAMSRLRAVCHQRTGIQGAAVALIGCPSASLRSALQAAVREAPELPKSPIGGPWALGQPINRGSYLFNFGDLTIDTVDQWIALARRLGTTQIDFHGGSSFRFGDCEPNPQMYPQGRASLKAVIDRLHEAGIKAGLHTYAFFIDKRCPWVTPRPDPRLAASATFTLSAPVDASSAFVPVAESTASVSNITGFFVRNSVTLRVDDELIVFSEASKEPPYGFQRCVRGALGTRAAPHAAGARVSHLKECFGLFVPDPETSLLTEVAEATARTYNECGFDMIYLDALDGEDILGGAEFGWHYGSRFVYELWKRLKRPALIEMSTFHHHLWCVRSRLGAWDHPNRSHKPFIDAHCRANADNLRMFLPGMLGWWAVKTWSGPQGEPTFTDDMEYLMGKCAATDTGFALMGVDPNALKTVPALPRLADVVGRWERLRMEGRIPKKVRQALAVAGVEMTLEEEPGGRMSFRPASYAKHRVEGPNSARWRVRNPHTAQTPFVRIEALSSCAPGTAAGRRVVLDSADVGRLAIGQAPGVSLTVRAASAGGRPETEGGLTLAATSTLTSPRGSWCYAERRFDPPLDLSGQQAVGVWVRGDGSGAVLNVQMRSPEHLIPAVCDRYVVVDFEGWRYVELVEPEGSRWADYAWPYGDVYSIYRESIQFGQVERVSLWLNHLPAGGATTVEIGPVAALPLATGRLIRPTLQVGATTVTFAVEMETGSYLEWRGGKAVVYGPRGEQLALADPQGTLRVEPGESEVVFQTSVEAGAVTPRARVSLGTFGSPIAALRSR